jgi:hypothetical protein
MSTQDSETSGESQLDRFARLDREINDSIVRYGNQSSFPIDAAKALKVIIDEKLYLAPKEDDGQPTYSSLRSYLYHAGRYIKRQSLVRQTAYKLIDELQIFAEVSGRTSVDPNTRSQLQALKRLDAEWRVRVWEKSVEAANDEPITETTIRGAASAVGLTIKPRPPSAAEKLAQVRSILEAMMPAMRDALSPRYGAEIDQLDKVLFATRKGKSAADTQPEITDATAKDPKDDPDSSLTELIVAAENIPLIRPGPTQPMIPPPQLIIPVHAASSGGAATEKAVTEDKSPRVTASASTETDLRVETKVDDGCVVLAFPSPAQYQAVNAFVGIRARGFGYSNGKWRKQLSDDHAAQTYVAELTDLMTSHGVTVLVGECTPVSP